jgi:hypothetical protein
MLLMLFSTALMAQQDSSNTNYNLIDSYPQNANVYINDVFFGNTPLYFTWSDSLFPKRINLKYESFTDVNEVIEDYSIISRNYRLTGDFRSLNKNSISENKEPYFDKKRKIFPITLSALITAGSGFAAYYFKSLADDNSKDYDIYGDPASLDRKDKYNLIGGISIAVLQVGFGALIYFLFID